MSERGPVGGAGELTAALEATRAYLETLVLEHSPDCSYESTDSPRGDFCDCGLKARKVKRSQVYMQLQGALAEFNASLAAKAPQGVPATCRCRHGLASVKCPIHGESMQPQQGRDFTRCEGLYLKFSDRGLPVDQNTPVIIERVNGDCSVSEFIIARDEAYKLVEQLRNFLGLAAPTAPSGAEEHILRVYKVEGHWYVDIDVDKDHSGLANGFTLSEAMDSANKMLQHMRNNAVEEGRLPREAAAPKPAPAQCPTCTSPAPHLHPAVQHEGEVQPCADAFHKQVTPKNRSEYIRGREALAAAPPVPAELTHAELCPIFKDAGLSHSHVDYVLKRINELGNRHASAERVRELEQALMNTAYALEGNAQYWLERTAYHEQQHGKWLNSIAEDIRVKVGKWALPPSTGEKS